MLSEENVAGHSDGGIMLLCPEERLLFTGDAINHHLWLHAPGNISVENCMSADELIPRKNIFPYSQYAGNRIDLLGHCTVFKKGLKVRSNVKILHCLRMGRISHNK